MTRRAKLKRVIRSRATRTGESYTAARRQVLKARPRGASAVPAARVTAKPKPAVSEASVVKRTGKGLAHWYGVLNAFGAPERGHSATARHLYDDHGVSGWYAQMITVAYERARGFRATNQSCEGDFQVSVSKVIPAGVAEVAQAFGEKRARREWLRAVHPGLRTALNRAVSKTHALAVSNPMRARVRYRWGKSVVELRIEGRAKGRASVAADNTKLDDPARVEERRAQWRTAFASLYSYLKD